MSNNNTILIFIDWFLPAYKAGGPVQSIANFVNQFKNEFTISIVTSDRDIGDTVPYKNVPLNQWIQKDGYKIMFLDKEHQQTKQYKKIINERTFDAIYLNSLFSVPFTLKPLLAAKGNVKKIVLAPRGMLGAGALQIKPLKKKIFIQLAKILRLFKSITWHATADSEKVEILQHFGKNCNVLVAPNLPSRRSEVNIPREKHVNELKLFFVSRIAQKKNLLEAIRILKRVSPSYKISFNIIGPVDEIAYWEQCKAEINNLPAHIQTNYSGAIPNQELANHISDFHFLLLPTLHENYGHAIIESMQFGCPVIISDRTPWRNLSGLVKENNLKFDVRSSMSEVQNLQPSESPTSNLKPQTSNQLGIGWDLPLEYPERFVEIIEYCARMDQAEYDAMSKRAFEYAKQVTEDPEVVEANKRLFL